jgi:hypothetical protein
MSAATGPHGAAQRTVTAPTAGRVRCADFKSPRPKRHRWILIRSIAAITTTPSLAFRYGAAATVTAKPARHDAAGHATQVAQWATATALMERHEHRIDRTKQSCREVMFNGRRSPISMTDCASPVEHGSPNERPFFSDPAVGASVAGRHLHVRAFAEAAIE